jgi:hypothetical protein
MKNADLGPRGAVYRKRRSPGEIREEERAKQAHSWQDWKTHTRTHVSRACSYLRREAKTARPNEAIFTGGALTFAAMIVDAAWVYGRPDLLVGMYYSEKWEYRG